MSNTDQMMKNACKTNNHEADENCQDTIQTKFKYSKMHSGI